MWLHHKYIMTPREPSEKPRDPPGSSTLPQNSTNRESKRYREILFVSEAPRLGLRCVENSRGRPRHRRFPCETAQAYKSQFAEEFLVEFFGFLGLEFQLKVHEKPRRENHSRARVESQQESGPNASDGRGQDSTLEIVPVRSPILSAALRIRPDDILQEGLVPHAWWNGTQP